VGRDDGSIAIVYPLATLMAMSKDAGLRIRIDRMLRDRFIEICRAQDKPAAQVLREFMRDYINANELGNKPSLGTDKVLRRGRQ
jgi:hypothetical protein